MARRGWSTANFFRLGSGVVTAAPFTMSIWGKTSDISTTKVMAGLYNSASGTSLNQFAIYNNTANITFQAANASTSANAVSSTTFSANTWFHACAVAISATSRAAYLNGGGKGTNATNIVPVGINRTSIGIADNAGTLFPFIGTNNDLAELAIWNIALSDTDVLSLSKGIHPFLVHPEALVGYWPLIGSYSPEINLLSNTSVMTMQGTLTAAPHTRVFYPAVGKVRRLSSAAVVPDPCRPPTWPAPVVIAWTPQAQVAQPSPGALLPPFPSPLWPAPAVVAWLPRQQPPQPPPGQLLPPFRPYTWPTPVAPAWQPAQQAAQPFLGLSIVVAVPFVPYPWPAPPAAVFRPQQPPAWFNPAPAVAPGVPFLPFSWPPPRVADFRGQQPQSWFNPTAVVAAAAPFKPFAWPRPIEARWAPQAQQPWFNPAAASVPVEEFCPAVLTTTVVRGASLSSGVVRGSARFAPTISGRAGLTSSTRKC